MYEGNNYFYNKLFKYKCRRLHSVYFLMDGKGLKALVHKIVLPELPDHYFRDFGLLFRQFAKLLKFRLFPAIFAFLGNFLATYGEVIWQL